MSTISDINYNNINSLASDDIEPGQRVIKITRNGTSVFYPVGTVLRRNKYSPILDHTYFHEVYDSVAYLDANNGITSVGWNGDAPSVVELWIASLDGISTGNILLKYGDNQVIVPVSGEINRFIWNINTAIQGEINITRLVDSDRDTLKDNSGNPVTAIVADWQVW